jgi:N-acylneuraminate cytidylyltransferase
MPILMPSSTSRIPERFRPIVAIIPARGGSKRIPGKVLAKVGKTSLLDRTVTQALRLARGGWIDHVLVSTEDAALRRAAIRAGGVVLSRPRRLATDGASTLAVLRHAIRALGLPPCATVVLLQATSPLREDADIAACLRRHARGGVDAVVTVAAAHPPPQWMFADAGDRLGRPATRGRRAFLRLNGAVYVAGAGHLLRRGFTEGRCAVVRMPAARSVDVDTPLDLEIARMLSP